MYTSEGKDVAERLWNQTLHELEFGGVKDALASIVAVSNV